MSKHKNVLTAMGFDIEVIEVDGKDFLNMSQMAKVKADDMYDTDKVCTRFFSNLNTMRFIEADQLIRNPKFKPDRSVRFKTGEGNRVRITASRLVNELNANCVMVKKGNMRDYATKEELQLLSYLEVCDAILIELGWHYNEERMKLIRQRAEDKDVMKSLMDYASGEDQFIHQKPKYKNPFLKRIIKSFIKRLMTGEVIKDSEGIWRNAEGF